MRLFFCETFDDGTVGGSHACMYNLIRNLNAPDIEITVGFYGPNIYVEKYREIGVPVEILPLGKRIRNGNPLVRKSRNWYRERFSEPALLREWIKGRKFDLVVLNNSINVSILFVGVCRSLGIPLVIYERGIGVFTKKHVDASRAVDASIPVSDAVRDQLLRYGVHAKVMRRIYDGIEVDRWRADAAPASVKRNLGLPVGCRVVGIIGNIRFWKGQDHFIDAVKILSGRYADIYGLIVGGWGEDDRRYHEGLREKVEAAGLADRVRFLGYRTDVPELLSVLDVFVHASTKPEPFGMVILEAMAARRPVVATNIGGPPEILDGGRCGILVPPGDAGAIANACGKYLEDESFRRETVERAYERLEKEFRISKTVEQTVALFRNVCRTTRSGTVHA
jgi:glycosyltransferase involved in cell wall biosynthesis